MKIHKIGATINWSGLVATGKRGGKLSYPDLTGWAAASAVRGRGFEHTLRCGLEIESGRTTLRLQASAAEQAHWRAGEAVLDVRFTSPDGDSVITRTAIFRLADAITGGA